VIVSKTVDQSGILQACPVFIDRRDLPSFSNRVIPGLERGMNVPHFLPFPYRHPAFLTVSIPHFLPFRKPNKSTVLFEFVDKADVFLDCLSVK
jgi:hypothetical protein